jgi:hypothetical protein
MLDLAAGFGITAIGSKASDKTKFKIGGLMAEG